MADKPFDLEAFKADPMRLRHVDGAKPMRASIVFDDCVSVQWVDHQMVCAYLPNERYMLRLAPKTRTVRLVACVDSYFGVALRYFQPEKQELFRPLATILSAHVVDGLIEVEVEEP